MITVIRLLNREGKIDAVKSIESCVKKLIAMSRLILLRDTSYVFSKVINRSGEKFITIACVRNPTKHVATVCFALSFITSLAVKKQVNESNSRYCFDNG